VSIDWRLVLFELLNFAVLMVLLGRFLFRPVREALAARRSEIEQRNAELAAQQADAAALRDEYRAKIAGAEQEGERLRAEVRREAEEKAEHIVAAARRDMDLARERQQADLELARRRSLESLRDQVVALSVQGAAKVVAGMSETSVASAYAREGARRLLEAGALPQDATVRLWTSPDADPDDVRQVVGKVLHDRCALQTDADPELVGGVRFAFRDLEVDASAGAALKRWLTELDEANPAEEPA